MEMESGDASNVWFGWFLYLNKPSYRLRLGISKGIPEVNPSGNGYTENARAIPFDIVLGDQGDDTVLQGFRWSEFDVVPLVTSLDGIDFAANGANRHWQRCVIGQKHVDAKLPELCPMQWFSAAIPVCYGDPLSMDYFQRIGCDHGGIGALLRGVRGLLHRRGGARSFIDRGSHVSSLGRRDSIHRDDGVFQLHSLISENHELKETDESHDNNGTLHPPLFRRMLVTIGLFFGGFFVSLRGWLDLNDNRRGIRAAWISGGLLLSGCGLGLWLATLAWPSTWSWWL
jgi:hypothetical protein